MCLSIFAPKESAPKKEPERLAAADIAEGPGSGPVTGAKRLRTATGTSTGGSRSASSGSKGTSSLRVALSLPGATGVNVPS